MKALRLMLTMVSLSTLLQGTQAMAWERQDGISPQQQGMQFEQRQAKHKHTAQQRQYRDGMMQQLAKLDLSDDQKQQIRQLMQQHRAERQAMYAGKEPSADRKKPSADRKKPSADRKKSSADRKKPLADRKTPSTRKALNALMQANHFDEVAIQQLLEQQQPVQLQRRLNALKLRHQISQVLTEEQRQHLQVNRRSRHSTNI